MKIETCPCPYCGKEHEIDSECKDKIMYRQKCNCGKSFNYGFISFSPKIIFQNFFSETLPYASKMTNLVTPREYETMEVKGNDRT